MEPTLEQEFKAALLEGGIITSVAPPIISMGNIEVRVQVRRIKTDPPAWSDEGVCQQCVSALNDAAGKSRKLRKALGDFDKRGRNFLEWAEGARWATFWVKLPEDAS